MSFDRIELELWALRFARSYSTGRSLRKQSNIGTTFEVVTEWVLRGDEGENNLRFKIIQANAEHNGAKQPITMLLLNSSEDFTLITSRLFPPKARPEKPKAPTKRKVKKKGKSQATSIRRSAPDK